MNDKEIMEGILLTAKGVCDLYLHGSIESATPKVHEAFNSALNDAIGMQYLIPGWKFDNKKPCLVR
jgi:spore coat protein CotF